MKMFIFYLDIIYNLNKKIKKHIHNPISRGTDRQTWSQDDSTGEAESRVGG